MQNHSITLQNSFHELLLDFAQVTEWNCAKCSTKSIQEAHVSMRISYTHSSSVPQKEYFQLEELGKQYFYSERIFLDCVLA